MRSKIQPDILTPGAKPRLPLAVAITLATLAGCAGPGTLSTPGSGAAGGVAEAPLPGRWITIGRSARGRPLEAATFGSGPSRIYLIGGVHGSEPEGQPVIRLLASRVTRGGEPGATVRILRDMNPDGAARGRRRSATGIDLNRNWPATNFRPSPDRGAKPLSEPETAAAHADIEAFGPDLVVVFHSIASGPFVNYDGPASEAAAIFVRAATALDARWRIVPDMGYPTPGSLGSYVGVDRKIPILTVEMKRGDESAAAVRAAAAGVDALLRASDVGGSP